MKILPALLIAAAAAAAPLPVANAADDVMIVYDASGSMWGQIDGINKIVTAREVMADLIRSWPEDTNLGLIAYGHRSAGSCSDIETIITPQRVDRNKLINIVNAIEPKGKTPITASLVQAADVLKYRDHNATIILISDGLESCHGDPCAMAAELKENGVDFTAHVVGFDLDEKGNEALSCIANNTGGIFVAAGNADELKEALRQVQAQVIQGQLEPEPVLDPVPIEPEHEVDINIPEQVITGASFPVTWSSIVNRYDRITIVPAGAKEGNFGNRFDVDKKLEGQLRAPAEPGLYEVRYVLYEGNKTLAHAPIEVVEAEQGISAPEQVITGASFPVTWSSIVNRYDRITIVPAGAKEGSFGYRFDVDKKLEGQLRAPAEPGLYEVRYVLYEGNKTLAHAPIEVVEAEQGISAPEQVITGASFPVTWSSIVNRYDRITIVPAGAKEGSFGYRFDVDKKLEGQLRAPAEPGLYEVRYVLYEGNKTLAHAPIEVVEAEQGISAPEQVITGASFPVTWSSIVNRYDRITIVPAGAKEGSYGHRFDVDEKLEGQLRAPAEPGLYEVRYVLYEGSKTLAHAPVEVVDANVTIEASNVVRAGTPIEIHWSAAINRYDRVTIVPAGAKEGVYGDRFDVGARTEGALKAPAEPGLYEVRYVLYEGDKTIARAPVEVVAESAPLDAGAGLQAPANASPGATITVNWTGGNDSKDQRVVLAKANAADFTWIAAHPVSDNKAQDFTLPDEPGRYEVRYLDVSNTTVLGRAIVEVK